MRGMGHVHGHIQVVATPCESTVEDRWIQVGLAGIDNDIGPNLSSEVGDVGRGRRIHLVRASNRRGSPSRSTASVLVFSRSKSAMTTVSNASRRDAMDAIAEPHAARSDHQYPDAGNPLGMFGQRPGWR